MKTFYTKLIITSTAICFIISLNLKAQNTFTPEHLKAAENMLVAMEMPSLIGTSIGNIIKIQTQNLPLDKQNAFSDVMKTFFGKYFSWDLLKTDFAKIYASEFSEAEIKELTVFYQTSLGKKMIEKSPVLMQKGMMLGQQMVITHQNELQEMIKAASPQN